MKNMLREIVQFKWLATYLTAMNLGFMIGYAIRDAWLPCFMGVIPFLITGYIAVVSWRKP